MSNTAEIQGTAKPRLKFIDMARSVAILMMLEGHFTGAALAWEYRDYKYPLFEVWHLIHGLTSPLFFTVTGLIFTYLLVGRDTRELKFWENIRVRKGFRRIGQLLFWGYFIQLNLWTIAKSIYYGTEFYMDWFYAFHVLQSIAFGLLIVILVYRIYKWINLGSLHWYYLIMGIIIFVCYGIMKSYIVIDQRLVEEGVRTTNQFWPKGAPAFIQNMFYGPYSDFSFVRMAGYTIFGAMMGVIVRKNEMNVKKWWFGTLFIVCGLLVAIFAREVLEFIDEQVILLGWSDKATLWYCSTSLSRFGQVVVLLGIIILIDKFFTVKAPLFLKIGQTTFPVYVVHVIILYGGVFGFGLKPDVFDRDLSPYAAIAISATAIAVFTIMVKYIEPLTMIYNRVVYALRLKKRPEAK